MHWALFAALAALVVLVKLLPLDQAAGGLPAPDLLLCLVLAWTVRRPDLHHAVGCPAATRSQEQ